ncbi:hypothetical protein HPT25_04990 [Bacillus sp. BRMEA1]|uniref:hypothetical protein n=1 Tax=Neobacillus endophyticus TaxID=2738405 RepID=UPI00156716EB|nr:hypothetical protein [Neobacillus endophyticus]NRD76847.1 hypothetical protein [Neobacillus endophyticus]
MSNHLMWIFENLSIVKEQDLEKCNMELENNQHNEIVRKALMVYKSELLDCLEMYDHYRNQS